jgi:hypothetical protein
MAALIVFNLWNKQSFIRVVSCVIMPHRELHIETMTVHVGYLCEMWLCMKYKENILAQISGCFKQKICSYSCK